MILIVNLDYKKMTLYANADNKNIIGYKIRQKLLYFLREQLLSFCSNKNLDMISFFFVGLGL